MQGGGFHRRIVRNEVDSLLPDVLNLEFGLKTENRSDFICISSRGKVLFIVKGVSVFFVIPVVRQEELVDFSVCWTLVGQLYSLKACSLGNLSFSECHGQESFLIQRVDQMSLLFRSDPWLQLRWTLEISWHYAAASSAWGQWARLLMWIMNSHIVFPSNFLARAQLILEHWVSPTSNFCCCLMFHRLNKFRLWLSLSQSELERYSFLSFFTLRLNTEPA